MFARLFAAATDAALRARGLRREEIEVRGWRLRIHRGGRPGGEPWLMLHGLGATAGTFLPLVPHLRDGCELVLPELSELGGSRGPRPAPTVREAGELAIELGRRFFPGRPPTVAGVSLGGWIAVRAALADPSFASRLVLVVPGGWADQDWHRIERLVRVETLAETRAVWRALFVDPPWWIRLGRYGLFLAYRSPTVRATLASVRVSDAFDADDLRRLEVPVGLIWGESDELFRAEAGAAMHGALLRSTFDVIEGAAHGVQWEKPAEFCAAVDRIRAAYPLRPPVSEAQDRDAQRR